MKNRIFRILPALLIALITLPHRLYAPPSRITDVSIAVVGNPFNTATATLISAPTAKIELTDITVGGGTTIRQYQPQPDPGSTTGTLIIERPWTGTGGDWEDWFLNPSSENFTLAYTGTGTGMIITWLDCLPIGYELRAKTAKPVNITVERLTIRASAFQLQ